MRWGCGALGACAALVAGLVLGEHSVFLQVPLLLTGYLSGLLLAETTSRPAYRGPIRRSPLLRRRLGEYAPMGWIWGWRAAASAACVALVVAGVTAAPDGRSFSGSCGTVSPWPGWVYGAPTLVALLVGAL